MIIAMNLKYFLSRLDDAFNNADKHVLSLFLKKYGRALHETKREDFLNLLLKVKDFSSQSDKPYFDVKKSHDDLEVQLKYLYDFFSSLNEEEVYLDTEVVTDFDGYYDSYDYFADYRDEEYHFIEHGDILVRIEEALEVLHRCADMEYFAEGRALFEILATLKIQVRGDLANECSIHELSLYEMDDYNLIPSSDVKHYFSDLLSFIYFYYGKDNGAKVFLSTIKDTDYSIKPDFDLKKRFRSLDAKEYEEFLIILLKEFIKEGDSKVELYIDDIAVILGEEVLDREAPLCLDTYPRLMRIHLVSLIYSKKYAKVIYLIKNAVPLIAHNFREKKEFLELGILCGRKLSQQKDVEEFCISLFSLFCNPVSYLKLRYYADDYHKYDDVILSTYEKSHILNSKFLKETRMADAAASNSYYLMCLLDGRAEVFFSNVKKKSEDVLFDGLLYDTGVMLCVLLLGKKEPHNPAFDFIYKELSKSSYFNFSFSHYEAYIKHLPVYEEIDAGQVLKLWCEKTDIAGGFESKLFGITDEYISNFIFAVLAAKKSSIYPKVVKFIRVLLELYRLHDCMDKKTALLQILRLKYSSRKKFILLLKEYGIKI